MTPSGSITNSGNMKMTPMMGAMLESLMSHIKHQKTIHLEQIEYSQHYCPNGHDLHYIRMNSNDALANSKCANCNVNISATKAVSLITCRKMCKSGRYCTNCLGSTKGQHILYFARQKLSGS